MAIGMATAVGAAQDLGLTGAGDMINQQLNETNKLRKRKAEGPQSALKAIQGRGQLGGAFADLTGMRDIFGEA